MIGHSNESISFWPEWNELCILQLHVLPHEKRGLSPKKAGLWLSGENQVYLCVCIKNFMIVLINIIYNLPCLLKYDIVEYCEDYSTHHTGIMTNLESDGDSYASGSEITKAGTEGNPWFQILTVKILKNIEWYHLVKRLVLFLLMKQIMQGFALFLANKPHASNPVFAGAARRAGPDSMSILCICVCVR